MPDGSVLIADQGNNRIRRVSPAGVITTVAGNGTAGYTGDGGAATAATISGPTGGGVHRRRRVPDRGLQQPGRAARQPGGDDHDGGGDRRRTARRVFPACGDGGAATGATLSFPTDVLATADGGFLISDIGVHVVRRVAPDGTISRVAGTY